MHLAPDYPISTRRLSLQPVTAADAEAMLAYRGRGDVCRYLPFPPMTREVLLARLAADLSRTEITGEGQALTLGVRRRDSGALVGDVMLFLHSIEHAAGELGYVFAPEVAGLGFATESCRALLRLGFDDLGLHRISARLDARNDRSARLAERLAMRREAHLVEDEMFKGEWSDTVVYGLLDREWRTGAGASPPR